MTAAGSIQNLHLQEEEEGKLKQKQNAKHSLPRIYDLEGILGAAVQEGNTNSIEALKIQDKSRRHNITQRQGADLQQEEEGCRLKLKLKQKSVVSPSSAAACW